MLKPVASSSSLRHVPSLLRGRAPDMSGAIIAVKVNALKFWGDVRGGSELINAAAALEWAEPVELASLWALI